MRSKQDIVGEKYGRLTVVEKVGSGSVTASKWRCKCECGNERVVLGSNLIYGYTRSCGCLAKETTAREHTKHGKCNTRLHRIWSNMKDRCYNDKNLAFVNYGGRGIAICEEWKNNFLAFYEWAIANGYGEKLTIERIDNDGNYEPNNCRWATVKEQSNNRRSNCKLMLNGEEHTIKEWAEITGIPYDTIKQRVKKLGWSAERALADYKKGKKEWK